MNGGMMARNAGWFKHWNNAHEGKTMSSLWAEGKGELIAFYWGILELVSLWGNDDGVLEIKQAILCRKFSQTSRKLTRNLVETSQNFEVSFDEVSHKFYRITVANWPKLQERRGKYDRIKLANKDHKPSINTHEDRGVEDRGYNTSPNHASGGECEGVSDQDTTHSTHIENEILRIYEKYPRKEGKSKALTSLKKQLKTNDDLAKFEKAVINYAKKCEVSKTEKQYIMMFSTFANKDTWIDHVESKPTQTIRIRSLEEFL